jgi:hypothetical protein
LYLPCLPDFLDLTNVLFFQMRLVAIGKSTATSLFIIGFTFPVLPELQHTTSRFLRPLGGLPDLR